MRERAFLEGYREDARPAAEAVETLLADPTPEKAAALLQKHPSLLPEDPAMAAVLAEAMAEEYGVWSSAFRVMELFSTTNAALRIPPPAERTGRQIILRNKKEN